MWQATSAQTVAIGSQAFGTEGGGYLRSCTKTVKEAALQRAVSAGIGFAIPPAGFWSLLETSSAVDVMLGKSKMSAGKFYDRDR